MRILLTGASGFLGSALATHLQQAGHELALLVRPSSKLDRLNGAVHLFDIGRCVSDDEVCAFVMRSKPDVVIHTACAYGRQGETATQILDVNVRLGLATLEALLRNGKPVTFINTGTVLMPNVSLYALSKHQFAEWGRTLSLQSANNLRFVNLQLQHMYGPGDDASKFTTHVLHTCLRNAPELDLTAGEQRRDFIYIDDVVSAYRVLVEQRNQLQAVCDIEVGSGVASTVREFVQTAHQLTSSHTQLHFGRLPYRPNEAMHCQANISKLKALGWQPNFDLRTGLQKTIELESHT
jgi:nucleoside-diphosphate-sugar epimerase